MSQKHQKRIEVIEQLIKHYENEFQAVISQNVDYDNGFLRIDIRYLAYSERCYNSIGLITHNLAMKGIFPTSVKDYNNTLKYVYEKDYKRRLR